MINKVEIDLNAIAHNLQIFKKAIDPETKIIGVVKSNAYGHGLVETSRAIWTAGADILATFSIDEAVALRVAKIRAPIIVLGPVESSEFRRLIDFDITLTVFDFETAYKLSREAAKQNKWARVDLKVDTGMSRLGFSSGEFIENYKKISSLEHIKVTGIHSHFADASDRDFSQGQILQMQNILFHFQQNKIKPPLIHMAATQAALNYSESHFDAIRVGIGIYGYPDSEGSTQGFMPAMELRSKISQLKMIAKGQSVGYKRTYVAKNPIKIAVIPIGYSDGYFRSLSNKAYVLIDGKRARVVGLVCMNVLMADATGIKCAVGDDVILIGSQGSDKVDAVELARLAGTNPHEVLSRINPLIPREYHFK
jgi:alanine racemase